MSTHIKKMEQLAERILKRKLLAVDDDVNFLELLNRALTDPNPEIELHCCDRGEHALALLAGGFVPDRIILDIRMPGMDGIETFRRIRQLYPNVEVIFLTGAPDDKRLAEIPSIGTARVMRKPDSFEEMQLSKGALLGVA